MQLLRAATGARDHAVLLTDEDPAVLRVLHHGGVGQPGRNRLHSIAPPRGQEAWMDVIFVSSILTLIII